MITAFFVLVAAGVILSFIRILLGPTSSDRVAALDTMNVMLIGTITVIALILKRGIYLDIALVYGLLSYLETVVISRYMEGRK